MSTQRWKVISLPKGKSHSVELKVEESLAPLRAFFLEANEFDYPRMIQAALHGVGTGFNTAGVVFPDDLDEDDKPMDPAMVEIYDALDTIQIPRVVYLRALLDVAATSFKVRRQRGDVPAEWERGMKEAIDALQALLSPSSVGRR